MRGGDDHNALCQNHASTFLQRDVVKAVGAYAVFRACLLALIIGAVVFVSLMAAVSRSGVTAFGILGTSLTFILNGVCLSGAGYIPFQITRITRWPHPLADALVWAGIVAAVFSILGVGGGPEVLRGALTGALMGCVFWRLVTDGRPQANDADPGSMNSEAIAQLKPRFHRDERLH